MLRLKRHQFWRYLWIMKHRGPGIFQIVIFYLLALTGNCENAALRRSVHVRKGRLYL